MIFFGLSKNGAWIWFQQNSFECALLFRSCADRTIITTQKLFVGVWVLWLLKGFRCRFSVPSGSSSFLNVLSKTKSLTDHNDDDALVTNNIVEPKEVDNVKKDSLKKTLKNIVCLINTYLTSKSSKIWTRWANFNCFDNLIFKRLKIFNKLIRILIFKSVGILIFHNT